MGSGSGAEQCMRRRLPNGWQKGSCSASSGQGSHSPNGLQTSVGWGSYVVVGDSRAITRRRQNVKSVNLRGVARQSSAAVWEQVGRTYVMNLIMVVRGNTASVDCDDFD